jgi:translocation and assembly module TamB
MLKGQYGAALVRDFADGREVAGYGRLEVGRVRGDVLGHFRIDTLSVRDEAGVWLEVEAVEIAWKPLALTRRVLDIELAEAASVRVLRRPERVQPDAGGGGGSFDLTRWRLNLENAGIGELYLAEGLAGPEASLTLSARLTQAAGAWAGALSAERLDAPGDRVNLEFSFDQALEATYEFSAAPHGPVTALLRVPGTRLSGAGALSGDLSNGEGDAEISVDGARALQLQAGWGEGRLEVSGDADLSTLPGLDGVARRISGPVRLRAEAPFNGDAVTDLDVAKAVLDVESGALSIDIRPGPERTLDFDARLGEGALALLTGEQLTARRARIEGRLDLSGDRSFDGRIEAEAFTAPGEVSVAAFTGPVSLAGPFSEPSARWDLQLTELDIAGLEPLAALMGGTSGAEGQAVWRRDAERFDISQLNLNAAAGDISAEGAVELGARRWRVEARSQALSLGAVTDLVGGSGPVSVDAEGGFDGAVRAEFQFSRFTPAGALAERLSQHLSGAGVLERSAEGELNLSDIVLSSPELELAGAASQQGEAWRVEGDAVWSGAAPISALTLDGVLSARFDAALSGGVVDARVEARTPALKVGPESLTDPRLRMEVSGPYEALAGEARLTGEGRRGALDLNAQFARDGETVRLDTVSGRASGFLIEGSAEAGPDALGVSARLQPEAGFGQLQLDASLQGGAVQAELAGEDLVIGDLSYLDEIRLTLEGPLEQVALSFAADGAYGATFELTGEGALAATDDARTLTTSLQGRYGAVPLATREPIEVQFTPELTLSAELDLGEGRGVFSYAGGDAPSIQARLEGAPAALLSLRRAREPVEGLLSGEASLSRTENVWTGDVALNGAGLRPARASEDRTLSGGVTARLDRERLNLTARASGVELSADADLTVETGPVASLGQLLDRSASIEGRTSAEGRIGDFAAFHIDPAQRLTGSVDLRAEISGVVGDPVLVGSATLNDARFSDARAGLDLRDLEAELDMTRSGARLSRLSATDGQGGSLNGTGTLDIATPLALEAQVDFEGFRLVDRNDAEAVGTGDVRFVLEDGQGRLSGSAVIDRADISPNGRGRAPVRQIEVVEINRPAGLDPAPEASSGPPVTLDYQVSAPRRVFVRGPNYDTEWSFDLAISGASNDPVLQGEARLVRGRAALLGRNFELERGQVILDGDPRQARLNVAAVNQRDDLTARVEVDGTVAAPEIRLTSQPALPEDEVASRILFGESAANLTALQAAQLAGALASLSGGSGLDPLGALRQAAGLDLLGVRRNAAGETVVSGGRYLTDDVFLQLEGASVGAAPATRIDWTLTPRFTLTSSLDAQGRAGLALSWRVEYDDDLFQEVELFRGFRDRMGLRSDGEGERDEADAESEDAPAAPD